MGAATPEEVVPGNMWTSQQLRAHLRCAWVHALPSPHTPHVDDVLAACGSNETGKDVWVEHIRPQMEAIAVQTMQAAYARLDRVQVRARQRCACRLTRATSWL